MTVFELKFDFAFVVKEMLNILSLICILFSWWSLVEKSWGIVQTYPQVLPFYSDFNQVR